jgi:hypothetical protein
VRIGAEVAVQVGSSSQVDAHTSQRRRNKTPRI